MSCVAPKTETPSRSTAARRARSDLPKAICMRCREAKCLYIIRSVTFCRRCFESNVVGRVSRMLHPPMLPEEQAKKSAAPRPKTQVGDVVLALSGGAGSSALLDLLSDRAYIAKDGGEEKRGRPPVWKRGYVVHVDFSHVANVGSQTERLKAMAEERGWTFVGVLAEDAFDPTFVSRLGGQTTEGKAVGVNLAEPGFPLISTPSSSSTSTPLDQLQALLTALPAPSRPALLENILNALLTCVAETLPNIGTLLVGETSTREAQRVISGTASGRGWSLPLELAVSRALPTKNKVVRIKAMKELSLKEAAFWCHGRHVPTFNERRWDSTVGGTRRDARGKGTIASIEALTERFIAGLNVTHPSTVSTINRTGDKLRFTGDNSAPLCPVCEMPVDPSAIEWKAQAALTALPGRGAAPAEVSSTPAPGSSTSLAPLLCYACLTTFTPLSAAQRDKPANEAVPLPIYVGESAARRAMTREEMKEQVAEFMLE